MTSLSETSSYSTDPEGSIFLPWWLEKGDSEVETHDVQELEFEALEALFLTGEGDTELLMELMLKIFEGGPNALKSRLEYKLLCQRGKSKIPEGDDYIKQATERYAVVQSAMGNVALG